MQVWPIAWILVVSSAEQLTGGAMPWDRQQPVGEAEGLLAYRFERGDLRYEDVVTMRDGSKHVGKVMEWANQVLVFEADGRPVVVDVADVEEFEFRRAPRHKERPNLPDLTVAYVERLPRDPSWHGHVEVRNGIEVPNVDSAQVAWHLAGGATATFRVHVLNAGTAKSDEAACRVSIDGQEIKTASIPSLGSGTEHVLEVPWPWQDGRHLLKVEVNPEAKAADFVRWNNMFAEPTDALALAVVVASDRYRAFQAVANGVDTFCFEDWVQYQVRVLNALMAASVYPSAPQGIGERLRCDRLIVVDDPADVGQAGQWQAKLRREGKADGLAEYAAIWVLGRMKPEEVAVHDALKVDWTGLRGVLDQLGLVALTATDTKVEQCLAPDQFGLFAQRQHLFPWRRTIMCTPGNFVFDERSAAFMNKARGRPRGFRGEFLYQLPAKIVVEVRSNAGTPLADAQVDAFQLMSEGEHAGLVAGYGRDDPLFAGRTDQGGRLVLPDQPTPEHKTASGYELRPNPFGKIAPDGSNGLLLLRVRQGTGEEFHFLRLYDCNIAYLRGQKQEYVHVLYTRLAVADAPSPPPYAAVTMEDRIGERPPMYIRWAMPGGTNFQSITEFRVYRRTSLGGDETKPWTLVDTVRKDASGWVLKYEGPYFEEFHYHGPYSLDTFYGVTTVDQRGRESDLSPPGYIAYGKDSIKIAMDHEAAYITAAGDGAGQMLRWDGRAGTQPYGVRTYRFKGYVPDFCGIAMTGDGRLVVTDRANHVLAFYERGDLVELVPSRKWWPGFPSDEPGEFYSPVDVAVDDVGNIYVADRDNNRVQVLDGQGRFKSLLDGEFQFRGPHALGYANGHLCVTDHAGMRCRVYDVQGGEVKFVRQLPPLENADRGLVGRGGEVYISGQTAGGDTWGILVFAPKDDTAALGRVVTEGIMGKFHKPRGLYPYLGGTTKLAYFVNMFPFDVNRCAFE